LPAGVWREQILNFGTRAVLIQKAALNGSAIDLFTPTADDLFVVIYGLARE